MLQNMFENKKTISFEVFPPKKDGEFEAAFETLNAMGKLNPDQRYLRSRRQPFRKNN